MNGERTGKYIRNKKQKLGIIGGGASGMFSACAAASVLQRAKNVNSNNYEIQVLEGSSKTMTKVAISGGGRCNVLHDTTKPIPTILSNGYPRGSKELNGLYNKYFGPKDAREWFESRGVELKTEHDGRMFPVTDSSQTIIDCIEGEVYKHGNVKVRKNEKILSIRTVSSTAEDDEGTGEEQHLQFVVTFKDGHEEQFDSIILATGSSPKGHEIASSLGHSLVPPVPSLFTLNAKLQVKDGGILNGLSGLSVPMAKIMLRVSVPGRKKKKVITQEGPLLITHHGVTGPAALRLSAFAAREFHDLNYRETVHINWAPTFGSTEEIESLLWRMTSASPKRKVASFCPLLLNNNSSNDNDEVGTTAIPKRLWTALVRDSGFSENAIWGEASKKKVGALARSVSNFALNVTGKGTFKEEFVTAGGVMLKQITMKTLESKKCPGLYFCGEVIDVDGVTGGFNFMNCWSTGHTSGVSAAERLIRTIEHEKQITHET